MAASLGLAGSAAAQSVDSLVAKHVEARGGAAAMRAITSLKMSGKMRPPGFDADLAYVETLTRPGSARVDATLQGLTMVQAYDGHTGWQIQPFQGRKDAEDLSVDDVKSLQEEADFDDALVDYRAKGSTADYLGQVEVGGGPTYAIRVSLKNGDQLTYYLDPDAFLTVRVVTRQLVRGAETLTQTDYGDYEKVNGVYFPFEVDSGPKGSPQQQRITYDRIVVNGAGGPAAFARPAAPAGGGVQQVVTPEHPEDKPPPDKPATQTPDHANAK
jgi:hypothetical protein